MNVAAVAREKKTVTPYILIDEENEQAIVDKTLVCENLTFCNITFVLMAAFLCSTYCATLRAAVVCLLLWKSKHCIIHASHKTSATIKYTLSSLNCV